MRPALSRTALAALAALTLCNAARADSGGEPPVVARVWWTGALSTVPGLPPGLLSLPANWSAPLRADDELGFGGAGPSLLTNDIAALGVRSLMFDGSRAYTLAGRSLQVSGGIVNRSGARQTISAAVQASGTGRRTWDGGDAGLSLTMAGSLDQQLRVLRSDVRVDGRLNLVRRSARAGDSAAVQLTLASSRLHTPGGATLEGGLVPALVTLYDSQWSGGGVTLGGAGQPVSVQLELSRWQADSLALRAGAAITLKRSELTVGRLTGAGGIDWISGVITVDSDLQLGAIAPTVTVDRDRQLYVHGTLTIHTGERAIMTGKSLLQARELRLAGGVLQAGVLGGNTPLLSGHGQWLGRVAGATGINASGGLLRLGDPAQAGAVDLTGTLTLAAGARVQLDSLDLARLGSRTVLAGDNQLAAANGMALGDGDQLTAGNGGRLQGALVNDGLVLTRRSQGGAGLLVLDGEVSGSGRFDGAFSFLAGASPGAARGNGLGNLTFGGSELWLGPQSRLTLDITAGPDGWTGDRLTGIGRLHAGGELLLRFHGVTPTDGDGWQALGFAQLDGAFSRISVQGLDGWRVDTPQLLASGRVSISPVPEPGAAGLMLLGLGVVIGLGPWCRRRAAITTAARPSASWRTR
ncbi:hypothetical protein ACG04Q_11030 [Roseateles sp. DXS20W]|uniref:PEP-CTERM sorting domain-containing protein n=1 Tax=Pelomonas lactea TaxID=3299030 RepID=A0ABW7GJG5_9BURK